MFAILKQFSRPPRKLGVTVHHPIILRFVQYEFLEIAKT